VISDCKTEVLRIRSSRCTTSAFTPLCEPEALTKAVRLVTALVICCRNVVLFFFNVVIAAASIVGGVDGPNVEEESRICVDRPGIRTKSFNDLTAGLGLGKSNQQ
jgi:hypothetical protein